MYVDVSFNFFLNGLCPGWVYFHPGDESFSKDLKLLSIGIYFGFHLGQQALYHSLHFVVWRYNDQDPMQFPIQPFLAPIVTILSVTINGVCIGDRIY
jgi:hypothetical protein